MSVTVPIDVYSSSHEILILIPVGGISKESIKITLVESSLHVLGQRERPTVNDAYIPLQEECYRGTFEKTILLPDHVYFDKIYSELTPENVLKIFVPKIMKPDEISVTIL